MRVTLLASAFALLAAGVLADPTPTPTPSYTVTLPSGKVLHHVTEVKDEGSLVIYRSDEGMTVIKKPAVAKDTGYVAGPKPSKDPGTVMQTFDPNQIAYSVVPTPPPARPTPTPAPTRPPTGSDRGADGSFKGCTIVSSNARIFHNALGSMEVMIQNNTDQMVYLAPSDFICTDGAGVKHEGKNFAIEGIPPKATKSWRVPPNGQIGGIVMFSNEAIDSPTLDWRP